MYPGGGSGGSWSRELQAWENDPHWQTLERQRLALEAAAKRNRDEAETMRPIVVQGAGTPQDAARLKQLDIWNRNQMAALRATRAAQDIIVHQVVLRQLKAQPAPILSR